MSLAVVIAILPACKSAPEYGLDISRKEVMDFFAPLGFTFGEVKSVEDVPTIEGRTINGYGVMTIGGPAENVSFLAISLGIPIIGAEETDFLSLFVAFLNRIVAPDAGAWFREQLPKMEYGDFSTSKTFNNRNLELKFVNDLGLFVTITGSPKN